MRRREVLLGALAIAGGGAAQADDGLPVFQRAAFAVHTLPELLAVLRLREPVASDAVSLEAPQLFEDGAAVPISVGCSAPGVRRLLVGVDHNPTWLAAILEPATRTGPRLSMRFKMQETSRVAVLAELHDGRVLMAASEVQITIGGCGGIADPATSAGTLRSEPTLIRLQPQADGVQVRALFKHEMESGQRQDPAGRPIPAWHIQQVVARVNGQPVWRAQWGTAVAKNPYLQFDLAGARTGDTVALSWTDNRGISRSDQAVVR